MRFRSDFSRPRAAGFFALTFVALIGVASPVLSSLVTTNIFVVSNDDSVNEDVYVTSTKGLVDGVINGDLTIFTGDLIINGTVTGSIHVFSSGTVTISGGGRVGGSIQGVAVNLRVLGDVGSDLFVTAASLIIEDQGVVGRDAMAFGGVLRVEGTIGRDVRGRTVRTVIDGTVGGDVDIATQKFELGSSAVVGGDVQYRSPSDGSIAPGAQISGSVKRLPTQSNFLYGVILSLANVIGFLGFLVAGIVALLVARSSASRAAGAMITNPVKTFLWGLGAVVAAPIIAVLLAATLVGLPLAAMVVLVMVAGLIIGPVPAVTALGNRVLIKRGGLLGGFVVGALLWRLAIWVIPLVGGVVFLLALVWGVGAWIVGMLAARNADPVPMALLPASMIPESGVPEDWEPPLAPRSEDDGRRTTDDGRRRTEDRNAEEADEAAGEISLTVDLVPAEDVESAKSEVVPGQDDDVIRRRAEFEALLDAAVNEPDEADDDDPSSDGWGLPTT